jgi:hypothetical protein
MTAKTGLVLALTFCGAALIYSATTRLSDQAINVIVGLMCGVAATIPVSLGLLIALTRRRSDQVETEGDFRDYPDPGVPYPPRPPRQAYPPVIVITPSQSQIPGAYGGLLAPGAMPPPYGMNELPSTRDFKIIGEDDDAFDA